MKSLSLSEIEMLTKEEPKVSSPPIIKQEPFYEEEFEKPVYPKLPTKFTPEKTPKKTNWSFIIIVIICSLFLVSSIWFNYSFSKGKAQGNSTIINNIDSPDIPVNIDDKDTNNYQHSITNQITVDISEADKKKLAEDIAKKVLEELNGTT